MDTVTMTRIGLKDCHGTLYECPCGGEFAVLEEAWEPKACPRCGGRVEKVVLPEDDSASWEQIGAYGEQRRADDRDGTRERLKAPRGMFRVGEAKAGIGKPEKKQTRGQLPTMPD